MAGLDKKFTREDIRDAKRYDKRLQERIEKGEAGNFTEALQKQELDDKFAKQPRFDHYSPIEESNVREEQETAIAADLKAGTPVLIRGLENSGKTSMLRHLMRRELRNDPTIFLDAGMLSRIARHGDVSPQELGLYETVEFLLAREEKRATSFRVDKMYHRIKSELEKTGKTAFEYLNEYFADTNEIGYLLCDEVIGFATTKQPELIELIADAGKMSNLRAAHALHWVQDVEDYVIKKFSGYKSYFLRPLTFDEVKEWMRSNLEGLNEQFSDDAIHRVLDVTGGRPGELNRLCEETRDAAHGKKIYSQEDVDRAAKDIPSGLKMAYDKLYFSTLNDSGKATIKKFIKEGPLSEAAVDMKEVKPLLDVGILKRDDTTRMYSINGETARRIFGTYVDLPDHLL